MLRPSGGHRLGAEVLDLLPTLRLDQASFWLHSLVQHAQHDKLDFPFDSFGDLVEKDMRRAAPAPGGVLQVVEANALPDPTGVLACRSLWIFCNPLDSEGDNPRVFSHLPFAEQLRRGSENLSDIGIRVDGEAVSHALLSFSTLSAISITPR